MSNRTLVELNHDFCPGRSTQALAEWGAKMAAYMRAADRTELPYGVTFKHIRHHSDPDPATRLAFADAAEVVLRRAEAALRSYVLYHAEGGSNIGFEAIAEHLATDMSALRATLVKEP